MRTTDLFQPATSELNLISMGAGQDSSAILQMFANNHNGFRQRYPAKRTVVVCSDTGNEFPETYSHIERMKIFCIDLGIEFYHLTPDLGFHTGDWQSLEYFYRKKNTVGSKAFRKICSQRLKIDVIYNWLEKYLTDTYNVQFGYKKGIRQFSKEFGKVRVILGMSKGEEKRCTKATDIDKKWYQESIFHCYPLIEYGWNREKCQEYLKAVGWGDVIPSNCMMCPFASKQEVEYLSRFHPDQLNKWVELEKNKLERWKELGERNLGVWGKKKLPEIISECKSLFSSWSDEQVKSYRFSHGHNVNLKF